MSFSVTLGASSAALDALSHAAHEHSARPSAASIADDGDVPPCGTHPPGNPPFPWALADDGDVPPCGTHPPGPPVPWPLAFASMLDPVAVNLQALRAG